VFNETVARAGAGHFVLNDTPMVAAYSQACVMSRDTTDENWEKAVRLMTTLATKLRLTPQARTDPKSLTRHPPLPTRQPWEFPCQEDQS
jgi:hypothetical protein